LLPKPRGRLVSHDHSTARASTLPARAVATTPTDAPVTVTPGSGAIVISLAAPSITD